MENKKYFLELKASPLKKEIVILVQIHGNENSSMEVMDKLLLSLRRRENVLKLTKEFPEHSKILRLLNVILYNSKVSWGSVSKICGQKEGNAIMLTIEI